jgi:hypothetical protein
LKKEGCEDYGRVSAVIMAVRDDEELYCTCNESSLQSKLNQYILE